MVINALLFNVSWFGLVLLGNTFIPLTLLWLMWHLSKCSDWREEARLIGLVSLIGICVDSLLTLSGFFVFPQSLMIIPFWLVFIWLSFSATLRHSLLFFSQRLWLQKVVGALCVPMSYFAAYKLGAVEFSYSIPATLVLIAIIWLFLFGYFMSLSKKGKVGYA